MIKLYNLSNEWFKPDLILFYLSNTANQYTSIAIFRKFVQNHLLMRRIMTYTSVNIHDVHKSAQNGNIL